MGWVEFPIDGYRFDFVLFCLMLGNCDRVWKSDRASSSLTAFGRQLKL